MFNTPRTVLNNPVSWVGLARDRRPVHYPFLAYHDTGASSGPTEGLNWLVRKVKRCDPTSNQPPATFTAALCRRINVGKALWVGYGPGWQKLDDRGDRLYESRTSLQTPQRRLRAHRPRFAR